MRTFKLFVLLLIVLNFYIGFHGVIQPFNILAGVILLSQSFYFGLFNA